jgi:hypothetical protein
MSARTDKRPMAGSSFDLAHERVTARPGVLTVVAAYAVLGAKLMWSRLAELGHSFWLDESDFFATFVRRGHARSSRGRD